MPLKYAGRFAAAVLLLLFSASALFATVIDVLDKVYGNEGGNARSTAAGLACPAASI
jgi:hypothetical protein